MASRLNPYISFGGNAREAMEFYRDVFGGELVVSTFGDFGQAGTPIENLVMHSQLETTLGFTLMASDTPPEMGSSEPGGNITISLSGDDADLRGYFERLAEEGTVGQPLEKMMWGDEFGDVTDKFGIKWLANISQPQG